MSAPTGFREDRPDLPWGISILLNEVPLWAGFGMRRYAFATRALALDRIKEGWPQYGEAWKRAHLKPARFEP
jgi:hypothetical protein